MTWNPPKRLVPPWMQTLAKMLEGVSMPDIRGRSLWVSTDYAFDNPKSGFDVVGLLVMDPEQSGEWLFRRNEVRKRVLPDDRRMAWKCLNNDSRRQAAFFPFLGAADHISGVAVALAFQRHKSFQIPADGLASFRSGFQLSPNWKRRNVQHMFRIAYSTAMFVAGLSKPGQEIHWVSDQDDAFANEAFENDTTRLFAEFLARFLPHKLGQVRYNTTAEGVEPLFQEDLLSVSDLMCGATSEIFTAIKREYIDIPDIYASLPNLSTRPRQFLRWYANGPWPLKRYICTFEGREGRPDSVGILDPRLLSRKHL